MTKICSKCKIEKSFDGFNIDKSRKDGLFPYCKDCRNTYNKIYSKNNAETIAAYKKIYNKNNAEAIAVTKKIYNKIYNKNNAEAIAVTKRWYLYKLNDEQYKRMLADQNNSCKTCRIEFDSTSKGTTLNIDHDHECCEGKRSCGKCVRGILCGSCNVTLGKVNDNIQTLQNMINYLKEYE